MCYLRRNIGSLWWNESYLCASGRVFAALAYCLDSASGYTFGSDNLGVLGDNGRFACLLTPPPLGRYAHCPDATKIELLTLTHFYTILVSGLHIGGCNLLLLSAAGITSNFFKNFISQVNVDVEIVEELLSQSQINSDIAPMTGQLVKCGEETFTRHLKCYTSFTSTTVNRQVTQMCQSVASIAEGVEELAGIECADEFVALAHDSNGLPLVTSSPTEIHALERKYAHVEVAIANTTERRKQKKAALLANKTEDEIEQEKVDARLKENAIRRARYASLTEDKKAEARLVSNESRQARLASMTEDEKEEARLAANAIQQKHRANMGGSVSLGQLNQSYTQLESRELFEDNFARYLRFNGKPRPNISSFGKARSEFSDKEAEELILAIWIIERKKTLPALSDRLRDYIAAHPDGADGLSEKLEDCQKRLNKVTAAWYSKRYGK